MDNQILKQLSQIYKTPLKILTMKQVKKFINLEYIVDVKNYKQSFDKWMKVCTRFNQVNEQQKGKMFNRYLYVIKPIVHKFTQTIQKFPSQSYGLYSEKLDPKQIQIVKQVLTPLKVYQIKTLQIQSPNNIKILHNSQVQSRTFKYLIGKLQKRHQQIYRLKLNQKPVNQEFKWWKNTLEVKPISIQGKVVNGKGEGRKSLGMPTANLEIAQNLHLKMDQYPNGVYFVDFDFINGQKYKGAGCLGTNPHYQNLQQTRKLEVYVLHDFGQRLFYGSQVVVTLKNLIRFEGKFHSFDAFLQAMHNDIYIAHQLCQKSQKNS